MAEDGGRVVVQVTGLEEANAYLKNLAAQIPQVADRIIEDGGEKIFYYSQQFVPVDTGMLQRSGSHEHIWMHSEISYNTPYAIFVHDGTSVMAPRPYLRGAAETAAPEIEKMAQEALDKL